MNGPADREPWRPPSREALRAREELDHPLAPVGGPFNAVMVEAPAITEVTMSGPGAGGVETASAVLGDVVSILVRSAAKLATIGLVCGLSIALVAGRLIESMLYGIRPQDSLAICGAVLLLSGHASSLPTPLRTRDINTTARAKRS